MEVDTSCDGSDRLNLLPSCAFVAAIGIGQLSVCTFLKLIRAKSR
jgi:hypothetical protein